MIPAKMSCTQLENERIEPFQEMKTGETLSVQHIARYPAEDIQEEKKPRYKNIVHLWEFLLELLADDSCRSLIVWSRQAHGEFKLKDQEEVAKRWGRLKCRPKMNYEKLSRALRHYYTQGIIKKVPGQRLVYKFHKLPYEYRPRNLLTGARLPTTSSPSTRQDIGQYLDGRRKSGCSDDSSDRPFEEMKKVLTGEAAVTSNLEKQVDLKQDQGERETPSPPDSMEFSSTPLSYGRLIFPGPLRLPVPCGYSYQPHQSRRAGSFALYPQFPIHDKFAQFNAVWNYRYSGSVPVSVIPSRYYY